MRKMTQKTPDARGETLRETNVAPVAFSLNQNSAVCLPLVSDGQKLIWVHSSQIDLQVDGAAELDEAFDRFPYLTQKQTAALAQRCSLHPDQVKVWFMAQRLRYGISWDYRDIREVRRKLSRGKDKQEKVKEDRGENGKWEREGKESDGKKAEVREDQSANEGRMMGGNVRANERLERKMKRERPVKKEDGNGEGEDQNNSQKKRKRATVAGKLGKKKMKQGDEGVVEREGELRRGEVGREGQKFTQTQTTLFTSKKKKKANRRFVVPDELLDESPALDVPPVTDNQAPNICMTPLRSGFEGKTEMEAELEGQPKELADGSDDPVVAEGSTEVPARIHWRRKTRTQLATMKVAFLRCQYPDNAEYNQLASLTGVPRYMLIQWFGDMRYYVKKVRPGWMNPEQHSRALANILYRQCLTGLAKAPTSEGEGTWKMKLEKSEADREDESVQMPPE